MRNEKWVFFQVPSKPSLNMSEVKYWKSNLAKILKSGLEFEFNLPNKKGSCKGTSKHCPCVKLVEPNTCWKECLRKEECKEQFGKHFKNNCCGIDCSGFIMKCASCENFELDCEKCESRYDPESDPDNIRTRLREKFNPSKNYGSINESGVHSIVCDGSLLGLGKEGKGVEIITTGRRVDYWEFFKMNNKIITEAMAKGAYVNERCSIHVHLLASYYGNNEGAGIGKQLSNTSELEKPLPQIVMANFHQLCRKYQNAITWMSSGLNDKENFTRWEKFRRSILDVSPVNNSMQDIISIMEERTGKNRGKYGWVNYMFTRFNGDGAISKFHMEMRSLDGILSASAVTAMTCLFYAMIIKAVEISYYGLLEVGSEDWMQQTLRIKSKLMNGIGSYEGSRLAYTGDLSDDDFRVLTNEALELNDQLKHILLRIGPVYEIIEKLAHEPPALKRWQGKTWQEVEADYAVFIPKETKLEKLLNSYIDMRTYTRCQDEKEWTLNVFSDISKEEGEDVSEALKAIILANKSDGEFVWSSVLGTMLKV